MSIEGEGSKLVAKIWSPSSIKGVSSSDLEDPRSKSTSQSESWSISGRKPAEQMSVFLASAF